MKKSLLIKIGSIVLAVAILVVGGIVIGNSCNKSGGTEPPAPEQPVSDPERDAFIESLGGVSETFEGSVSTQEYSSAKEAAESYVKEEMAGKEKVTVVGTTSKGTLSKEEVSALKLPASDSVGVQSVEKIEVEYSETQGIALMDTANENKKVTAYIIKYASNAYKYFVPCPANGETINKTYFESVFNSEKYKNCTVTVTGISNAKDSGVSQGHPYTSTANLTYTQQMKFTENQVLSTITINGTSFEGGNSETISQTISFYVERGNGAASLWIKVDDGAWELQEAFLIITILNPILGEEQLAPFYDESQMDYTCFTKADYGFKLEGKNAQKYIASIPAIGSGSDGDSIEMSWKWNDIEAFAEYYVKEGVLSGGRMDVDASYTINYTNFSHTVSVKMTTDTKVTDYGTTTVEKPF